MEKTKSLLEKNWIWSALAFGIPIVVAILICAAAGIYPFGENCMLHIDMYHQYCPFFMEFWEKLHEGGSLLYFGSAGFLNEVLIPCPPTRLWAYWSIMWRGV